MLIRSKIYVSGCLGILDYISGGKKMKIGNISANTTFSSLKKISKKSKSNDNSETKTSKNAKKSAAATAGLIGTAVLIGVPISSCSYTPTLPAVNNIDDSELEKKSSIDTLDSIAQEIAALNANTSSDKISLSDISLISVPVSELYLTSTSEVVEINPNENLPANENGTIIVTITEDESEEIDEGSTLGEIIEKVYSEALDKYEGEERTAIYNKLIDETIQANPSLSQYIADELGEDAASYEDIASLNLYKGSTSNDETLDTRLLTMPTALVYQVQGKDSYNYGYNYSTYTYSPEDETASVIKDSDNLIDGEYSSISDLIYAQYGEDISDEAYRDILYAIVNSPENASEFEYVIDEMNFNDIVTTANITDLNRTLDENTSDMLLGLSLPSVATLKTSSNIAEDTSADKDAIIYQISPAAVVDGQDDKVITLTDKASDMEAGDVYTLKDVLQYYSSPDGNGRFANVVDGELILNSDVNYVDEFAINILQQVAYANLDIFTAEYEDENGTYKYGIFDVNEGYDTEGKSLEEIIQNSTINIGRLMRYSFVDEDGISKFEDGVTLNLPQFNYRLNEAEVIESTDCNCKCDCCNPDETPQPQRPEKPEQPERPNEPTGTPNEPTGTPNEPTGTPNEPTGTPNEPTGTPDEPTGTPNEPTGTPAEPTGTPNEPTGTPDEPTGTPNEPTGTPNEPTGTPDEPTGTPNEPTGTPDEPTGTPNEPTGTPNEPTGTPDEPTGTPNEPTGTPDEPTGTPNEPTGTPDEPTGFPTDVPTDTPTVDPTLDPTDGASDIDPVDPTEDITDPTCDDDPSSDDVTDEDDPTLDSTDGASDIDPVDPTEDVTDPTTEENPTCDDDPSSDDVTDEDDPTTDSNDTSSDIDTVDPTEDVTDPTCDDDPSSDDVTDEDMPTLGLSVSNDTSSEINSESLSEEETNSATETNATEDSSEDCNEEGKSDESTDEETPSTVSLASTDDSSTPQTLAGKLTSYLISKLSSNSTAADDDGISYYA